ncbi:MAG TPA: carboxypeptidase-like regulatory domain-containing protein, partial [Mucilaginibacter sp.]
MPLFTWAQSGVITGKVVRMDNKSPVAGASVFLGNSSFGTATAPDGTFTLNGVRPGQYTLVVAVIGYQDHTQTILVGKDPIHVNIELETKSIMLREVQISDNAKADWKRNYEQFKKEFIGNDENAKNCEVINPEVLNFTYYKTQKRLEAYADEFLIVENRSLGYRVKFLVRDFKSDHISGIISYSGQRLFEDLPGKEIQKKKWATNRDDAYYGSAMHFYRSLYKDRLNEDGFEMHRFTRMLNPERPDEAVIQRNIERFSSLGRRDSVNKWIYLENLSRYAHE